MKRGSGILLHLTSLPSKGGIGDLGPEAYAFADFLVEASQKYWQILPLNPTNNENYHSPYLSSGAFAGNPLLVSPELLFSEGLVSEEDLEPLYALPKGDADFPQLVKLKRVLLEKAYTNAHHAHKNTLKAFDRFCHEQASWLEDYSLYITLQREFEGAPWSDWPEPYRVRDRKALKDFAAKFKEPIIHEKFFQFLFFTQWNALKTYCNRKGLTIVGDIPIYVSFDSCDVWAHPGIFKLDAKGRPTKVSGVPPDYFSATGQLWNTPVYDWEAVRQTNFTWWMYRLEMQLGRCDVLRIDHFRGLVQYWEVTAGESSAINGSWQPVPTYEFFDTMLARFPNLQNMIIAEDLGIITDDVREAMHHYNFPGMKVLQFAFGEDNPDHPYRPHTFEPNCVAYTGTHDNNTLFGWIEKEATAEEKQRFYDYIGRSEPLEELVWETIGRIQASKANMAIIPAQDLLMLPGSARMNTPSRPDRNWTWRMRPGQLTPEIGQRLSELARATNRL